MVIHLRKDQGHVTDGRTLDQCMEFLPNGDYVATIETKTQWLKRQPRTLSQNALLHVWFKHIAVAINTQYGDDYWNADKVKDYFAMVYATDEVTPDGKPWRKPVSTSKLTKKQMTEYMERIQAHMLTEHGIRVPLPEDERFKDFQLEYS
jgi:hypothetical protein